RADRGLPRHRSAGPVRRDDRVLAGAALHRVEVAQALPQRVPRPGRVRRGARGQDPRRRGRGAPARRGQGSRHAPPEGARRDHDHRHDLAVAPGRPDRALRGRGRHGPGGDEQDRRRPADRPRCAGRDVPDRDRALDDRNRTSHGRDPPRRVLERADDGRVRLGRLGDSRRLPGDPERDVARGPALRPARRHVADRGRVPARLRGLGDGRQLVRRVPAGPMSSAGRLALSRLASLTAGSAAYIALISAIYNETGSALWVSAALFFGVVGSVIGAPAAGWIGDRFERRWVMVGSDLAAAVVATAMALTVDSALALALLFGLLAVVESPFEPASASAMPNLVRAESLPRANALVAGTSSASYLLGPLLGGLLLGVRSEEHTSELQSRSDLVC